MSVKIVLFCEPSKRVTAAATGVHLYFGVGDDWRQVVFIIGHY